MKNRSLENMILFRDFCEGLTLRPLQFEPTLASVEASVALRAVAWCKDLLGAKAAAEPAERTRTAVESFMVSMYGSFKGHFFMNS